MDVCDIVIEISKDQELMDLLPEKIAKAIASYKRKRHYDPEYRKAQSDRFFAYMKSRKQFQEPIVFSTVKISARTKEALEQLRSTMPGSSKDTIGRTRAKVPMHTVISRILAALKKNAAKVDIVYDTDPTPCKPFRCDSRPIKGLKKLFPRASNNDILYSCATFFLKSGTEI